MIPVARAAASGRYKRVIDVKAAQMGKTDILLDLIGHRLDQRAAPIIYVGPTKQFVTEQFEPRVMALLDQAPTLMRKVLRGKRMTKTRKTVGGVALRLAHGGSSTALKSDPAALAIIDEYDEMLANVKGQGDPLGLVEARGDTYADFVAVVASTPSMGASDIVHDEASGLDFWKLMSADDVESAIWSLWQQGSMHHWTWQCPHCRGWFIPRFRLLRWPKDATPAEARKAAYLLCPAEKCGGVIEERHKAAMNATGVYVAPGQTVDAEGAVRGEPPESSTISFWASGLASPFVTFGQRAEAFLIAVQSGDREKIQTVINAGFGELYAPGGGDAPEVLEVHRLRIPYKRGEVPAGVRAITAGVDVQKNRLVHVIRGWGARGTSWLIDHGELWGPTAEPEVWALLEDLLEDRYAGLPIRLALIDSGFRPTKQDKGPEHVVYDFCRRHQRQCKPSKGYDTLRSGAVAISKIEVTPHGKATTYSIELVRVNTDWCKLWVHERIRWPQDQPGAFHLPIDVGDDYCLQLVSEARIRKPSGRTMWVQRSRENHYLDCFDKDTELLTYGGWVRVDELHSDLNFATVNLTTDEIEYQHATKFIGRWHDGEMVSIRGRRIDALVTPNHRMIVYRKKKEAEGTKVRLAGDLDIWDKIKLTATWRGSDCLTLILPASETEEARRVDAGDWMEFLGWYVAEGHRNKASNKSWRVVISQNAGEKQDSIKALLVRLGIRHRLASGRQFTFHSHQIFHALDGCYENGNGRGCYRKRVPEFVRFLSSRLISRFVDAAVLGDGWQQKGFRAYATTSPRLADDMQELFLKIGNSANIVVRQPPNCRLRGEDRSTVLQYHVSETKTRAANLRQSDNTPIFRRVEFSGMVYCVTVPNGTLVARRNGKMFIAGNCEAMAYAAGYLLGVQRIPDAKAPKPDDDDDASEPEAKPPLPDETPSLPAIALRDEKPKPPKQPRVIRSTFMAR